jgi:ribosomal protein S18 acetylase RimI-like enzyme
MQRLFNLSPGNPKGADAMPITLRLTESSDHPFLFELYTSTRKEEVAARGWDVLQQQAFMRMQYRAQQWQYRGQLTQIEDYLILDGEQPVGRLLISHERGYIHLADIALLAAYREQGIGTELMRALQAKATRAGKAVRLSAPESNRAVALFKRLGFKVTGEQGNLLEMEWRPPSKALPFSKSASASQKRPPRRTGQG